MISKLVLFLFFYGSLGVKILLCVCILVYKKNLPHKKYKKFTEAEKHIKETILNGKSN